MSPSYEAGYAAGVALRGDIVGQIADVGMGFLPDGLSEEESTDYEQGKQDALNE